MGCQCRDGTIVGAAYGAIAGAMAGAGAAVGGWAFGTVGATIGAAAGGALSSLFTNGDPLMAAASAGIGVGIGFGFNVPTVSGAFTDIFGEELAKLALSTGVGALAGGITAEIFGGNFGQGALWGAASAAAAYATKTTLREFLCPTMAGRNPAHLTIKLSGYGDREFHTTLNSVADLEKVLTEVSMIGEKITFFEYVGHGFAEGYVFKPGWPPYEYLDQRGEGLSFGDNGLIANSSDYYDQDAGYMQFGHIKDLVITTFAPNARVELEACYSAYGDNSIAHYFKNALPDAKVFGFAGTTRKIPFMWETFKKGYDWREVKK
jgi:hypothetical protein